MEDPAKRIGRAGELVAGVVATTALGAGVLIHLPLVAAVAAAAAVYGGMRLLLPSSAPPSEELDGATRQVIVRGREQIAQLRRMASAGPGETVRKSVMNVCATAEEIFSIFEATPHKAPLARGFVGYTLTQTVTIFHRYQELSLRRLDSAKETLAKTESLLDALDVSFRAQLARLLEEDVADLDSEIDVLKTRIEIEGEP